MGKERGRGQGPDSGDSAYEITVALAEPSMKDPDAFRAFMDIVSVIELPEVALGRPGVFDKVIEHGANWRDQPTLGPSRDELIALATA